MTDKGVLNAESNFGKLTPEFHSPAEFQHNLKSFSFGCWDKVETGHHIFGTATATEYHSRPEIHMIHVTAFLTVLAEVPHPVRKHAEYMLVYTLLDGALNQDDWPDKGFRVYNRTRIPQPEPPFEIISEFEEWLRPHVMNLYGMQPRQ